MQNSRRVHLDFHTSEYIEGIGTEFDKEQFQKTIKEAHITQMTLFAKCHHGWCYYPTKVGTIHPHLKFDLLGSQVEACHEIGVKAVVYITGGWSVKDAREHPEWLVVSYDTGEKAHMEEGCLVKPKQREFNEARPTCSWDLICLAGDYKRHIYALTKEICSLYPSIDGLFYDICCLDIPCICETCKRGMAERGLDSSKREDVLLYLRQEKIEFMEKCRKILHAVNPRGSIFFNSGGAEISQPYYRNSMTHYELEDLPTVSGYNNIYNRAKYFLKEGKEVVGMTGKFRYAWGEFGSYKKADALRYECAAMLMLGMCCSVGDQLHPLGRMDPTTYSIIRKAFGYVEKIEKYCYDCQTTARLGVVLSERFSGREGISAMLAESQLDYEIVDEKEELLSLYDCIILCEGAKISPLFSEKLRAFVQAGKSLVVVGDAGLQDNSFVVPTGVKYIGAPLFDTDYLECSGTIRPKEILSPMLAYHACHRTEKTNGLVLAWAQPPYFSRTEGKYCSHRNTPNDFSGKKYPAVVRTGNVLYFAHEIGRIYFESGDPFIRELFIRALKEVYHPPLEIEGLMSCGRARLTEKNGKYYLHLLYAAPVHRGNVILLDDFPVLNGVRVKLKLKNVKRILRRPQGTSVPFSEEGDIVSFTIDNLHIHQLLEIERHK